MLDLSAFDRVEKNLQTLGIDEIVKLLGPLKIGMMMEAPIFEPGNFLYRGRKLTTDCAKDGIKLADLKHPPQESVPLGRVNRERKPMFYCAASKEVVFFEIPNLISGDEIILTFWQTTSKMLVSNIGYRRASPRGNYPLRIAVCWPHVSDGQNVGKRRQSCATAKFC